MIRPFPEKSRYIAAWLFACAGLVVAMIMVGAVTRLTESGLSMVEWRPLIGWIPPLSEQEWTRIFTLYKESPEFQKKNFWMSADDFRMIFFWEWFHRLLGRLIGLTYAFPFFIFLIKGWIPPGAKIKLFGILILGGLQGLMGWYMVKSGLVDIPSVSHYRLAAHLGLAFLILGFLLWTGFGFLGGTQGLRPVSKAVRTHILFALLVVVLTITWGAFVAGLDAGMIYNEFPHMNSVWVPTEDWQTQKGIENLHSNPVFVQFTHRWLGVLCVLAMLSLWLHAAFQERLNGLFHSLLLMVFVQAGLGIATLLSQVNITLAVLHQAGAIVLFCLLIALLHRLRTQRSA